jgi:hypothetical protein
VRHRIVGAVQIAVSHRQILVSQEVAHQKCVRARLSGVAADCMAKVMQTQGDLIVGRIAIGKRTAKGWIGAAR